MKKILAVLVAVILMMSLAACGGKKCSECGERAEKGYTIFGNFVCESCMW